MTIADNQYKIVTGCSSGIGEALAQHIANIDNRVVATARNPTSLSNIPDGENVLKLPLDVTSIESIESALSATLSYFHRIDVVVNNAGYTLAGDTEAAGDAEARALMDTNFWGMVDVTKRALGIMRDENTKNGGQQGGVVLNVSSMGGWFGFPACSFYHASKFAMVRKAMGGTLPLNAIMDAAIAQISLSLTRLAPTEIFLSELRDGRSCSRI